MFGHLAKRSSQHRERGSLFAPKVVIRCLTMALFLAGCFALTDTSIAQSRPSADAEGLETLDHDPVDSKETLETEHVVLLHGLGRTTWSMLRMEAALSRAGYDTHNIGYPSTDYSIAELTEQIGVKIRSCCSEGTVHFVTHSLGGILVRSFLANGAFDNVGRVVMLSPPNQGSEIVDVLADQELFQHGLGPSGSELGTEPTSVPNQLHAVDFPLGVITGDRTINPLFSWWIPGEDDGKVSVESAKVDGMVDFLVLPYTHTFIMNAADVIEQTEHFLAHGRFEQPTGSK